MAPAIVQGLTLESLARIGVPVAIILGDADPVAPPATNGLEEAREVPNAQFEVAPVVGHYDFLADCTPAGLAAIPVCAAKVPQENTHAAPIDTAVRLFDKATATATATAAATTAEPTAFRPSTN